MLLNLLVMYLTLVILLLITKIVLDAIWVFDDWYEYNNISTNKSRVNMFDSSYDRCWWKYFKRVFVIIFLWVFMLGNTVKWVKPTAVSLKWVFKGKEENC